MYYVYVLKCANDDLYVGYSTDLKSRVSRHLSGKVRATKSKLPVKLIYYEAYSDKRDATRREKQLKMHRAKKDLLQQIKNSFAGFVQW